MRFEYQNPELERQVAEARSVDALDSAIDAISKLIPSFFEPTVYGRQAYWKALDAMVPEVARRLQLKDTPLEKSNDDVCILATRFYQTGGHSKVAADIAALLGADRTTLVLTDLYRQLRYRAYLGDDPERSVIRRRALVLLSAPSFTEKILELYMTLRAMRPSRILLLCNHMDMVAVTAAWPFRSVVEFIHHADHQPALGATLPFSAHVDLNYPIHLACREVGLGPLYAGLTTQAAATVPPRREPGLRIVTCGGLMKYRHPGLYRWTDYVLAALSVPGAELIHVGPVDEAFRSEIAQALGGAGIDPARYVFAGVAPSLPEELANRRANVFLASYPTAGGRADLEAMACGLPTIVPADPGAPPLIPDRWPLPQFTTIASPAELPPLLADLDRLAAQARDPANLQILQSHLRRFEDFVLARPMESFSTDEVLPD